MPPWPPSRLPVQYVNRPNLNFRGFCGTIAAGSIAAGDTVRVLPSGKTSQVRAIVTADGVLDLNPKKSMIRYLVDQGFDVFITSWKNPGEDMRDVRFDEVLQWC